MKNLVCSLCNEEYIKKPRDNSTMKACASCKTNSVRRKRKIKLVEYKGGKCEYCGYNKCMGALVFHHKDPSVKSFEIGPNVCKKYSELFKEIDKCLLLCHNCHSEIHENITKNKPAKHF